MNRFFIFIGKHKPDIYALILSFLCLIIGLCLGLNSEPIWLNRSGAIIIIIGVCLAANNFPEWVQTEALQGLEKELPNIMQEAIMEFEKDERLVTDEKRKSIEVDIKSRIQKNLNNHSGKIKNRIKKLEITLIVLGTFLNGFGDYFIGLLKNYTSL
ncbi:MAG: hypothetical protein K2Y09_07820 [Nitrosomonas sp.]|uniref:hypothetical protein n=1 Tax=Nitrosomonas sp. TaxID=42353 RepID=UPI001DF1E228|nr:hypothetical protein [Nitrosomonas sp.]MBX9895070.1 hypothetical protein [Nitrosomonas sp.]